MRPMWADDRAPQKLSQIVGNPEVVRVFRQYLDSGCIPNLLLYGPPGCGKHAAVGALLREADAKCLQIYGSIIRGKEAISEAVEKNNKTSEILTFAQRRGDFIRFVMIHDFDCMTNEAQMALRRIMEIHGKNTRFVLFTETLEGIIEAIQSRCAVIRFERLSPQEIVAVLSGIDISLEDHATKPGLPEQEDHATKLRRMVADEANGDLKAALNLYQFLRQAPPEVCRDFLRKESIPHRIASGESPEEILQELTREAVKRNDAVLIEEIVKSLPLTTVGILALAHRAAKSRLVERHDSDF
ncbi:MAG: AAA family ATPase [Sulfobacillus sp.]